MIGDQRYAQLTKERDAAVAAHSNMVAEANRLGKERDFNRAILTNVLDQRDDALAAVERVKALHAKNREPQDAWCSHDGYQWPCPTIRALEQP